MLQAKYDTAGQRKVQNIVDSIIEQSLQGLETNQSIVPAY